MHERLPSAIGVVGGMGPRVDPLLLDKLLAYQASLGLSHDQDTVPVLLAQYGSIIDDRTRFLLDGRHGPNPAVAAAHVARSLMSVGAVVLGVPCNTFHAPAIFSRFEAELGPTVGPSGPVHVIHMIRSTVEAIRMTNPNARRVGVLSTNGTYLQRIYADPLVVAGFEVATLEYYDGHFSLDEQEQRKTEMMGGSATVLQNDVHDVIYNPVWGIKSGSEASSGYPSAKYLLHRAIQALLDQGAELVVLGCTELPLAIQQRDVSHVVLLDPLDVLARTLVDTYRSVVVFPCP